MTALELPGGALPFHAAVLLLPARSGGCMLSPMITEEKKNLALDMGRDCPPSLLVAVNSFQRNPKEFRHFLLGLS